jgi:hypothetical protein
VAMMVPAVASAHYPDASRADSIAVAHVKHVKCDPVGGCFGLQLVGSQTVGSHSRAVKVNYRRPGGCYAQARIVVNHYYHVASASYYCV